MTGEVHWVSCAQCASLVYAKRFERELRVWPSCGWRARLSTPDRLAQLLDPGSAQIIGPPVLAINHLGFTDTIPYSDRLELARRETGLEEAAR